MDEIAEIKKRAGISEQEEPVFEILFYGAGSTMGTRPHISEGDRYYVAREIAEELERTGGEFNQIVIKPKNPVNTGDYYRDGVTPKPTGKPKMSGLD